MQIIIQGISSLFSKEQDEQVLTIRESESKQLK